MTLVWLLSGGLWRLGEPLRLSIRQDHVVASPLPSSEVYDRLRAGLDPLLRDQGMERSRKVRYPCWRDQRAGPEASVFVSLQVDAKATDPFAGGGFRVEVEKSTSAKPSGGITGRAMFFQLLTEPELETVLAHQNTFIEGLERPSTDQVAWYPASLRDQYLSYFQPQDGFDAVKCWLRYRKVDDLEGWVAVLTPLIGPLIERATSLLSPSVISLGKGSLLHEH